MSTLTSTSRAHAVPRLALFLICIVMLLLTACGSGGGPQSSSAPTATATPSIPHQGQSAGAILAGLKSHGLPISASFTYDASNDLNHLLGRPGQYTGKINFADTRIPSSGDAGANLSVDDGGSIEVFANLTDATNRTNYVKQIAASSPLFNEYDYQDGVVLLRLSKTLTPDQAQTYLTALKTLP